MQDTNTWPLRITLFVLQEFTPHIKKKNKKEITGEYIEDMWVKFPEMANH